MHHALAVGEGDGVPVGRLAALAVHGVEGEVFGVGDGGEEARGHGGGGALEAGGDFGLEFGGVGFEALGAGGFPGLAAGLVEAELDDGDVGVGSREVVRELGLGQVELDLVEGGEGVAEMDEDEVALVADLREEGGLGGGAGGFALKGS